MYRGGTGQLTWLMHRISGVAVVYFLSLHIFETLQLARGAQAYNDATAVYHQPWFRPFEFLLVMAVVYHALNGLRVMLFDYFPQTTRYRQPIFWIGVAVFVVLTPLIGYFMLNKLIGMSLQDMFRDLKDVPYALVVAGPLALPVLYLLWRGTALGEGRRVILSASNSAPVPSANRFEKLAWGFMRVSGVIMVFLVLFHLFIMHIERDITEVTGQFVATRFQNNPVWIAIDLSMLFLAWLHGLNGVRIVLTDYMRKGSPRKIVLGVLGAFGLVWLVAGGYVLFLIPSLVI
ncbi:MAG TPA: succinate dehydrogenase, cytochrome b556 subunit [Anaerolineae bacterium]